MGHLGACLVTVTTDACVRLWELNRDARHSFDEPALALDLKKLANASSSEDDFRASKYGTSKAFSPDSVEMEVAAACFGGLGSSDEHGWSPMTLWVAMTEGDVYALCPLLPSKWEPSLTTIPSLTTSVVAKTDMIEYDADISDQVRRTTTQQRNWLADIDSQQPFIAPHPNTLDTFEVYDRPAHPPAIPKLQGPFQLTPEPDYSDITDILVIAPRVDDEALMQEEEDVEPIDPAGLSVGVICLATKSGDVHVCLDLNGVEAQWLPTRRVRLEYALSFHCEYVQGLLTLWFLGKVSEPAWKRELRFRASSRRKHQAILGHCRICTVLALVYERSNKPLRLLSQPRRSPGTLLPLSLDQRS